MFYCLSHKSAIQEQAPGNRGNSGRHGIDTSMLADPSQCLRRYHTVRGLWHVCRGEGQEPATSSRGSASQPIDMSMRAEHNKVRSHLAGSKKDRSSPYGTPIAKSPLSSPLIADAAALEALNLNPGSAKSVSLHWSRFLRRLLHCTLHKSNRLGHCLRT